MAQGERYQVIVTMPAESRYRYTLLPYLLRNFSIDRAVEIETSHFSRVQSLALLPHRGTVERTLQDTDPTIRFIPYMETRHFELKTLYYVDEHTSTVFVVDYFPTAMHPRRMTGGR